MRNAVRAGALAAVTLTALIAPGRSIQAKEKILDITLRFVPQESTSADSPVISSGFLSRSVRILPFIDGRRQAEPKQVGENTEEDRPVPVHTEDDVPGFATEVFRKVAGEWGVRTAEDADLVLGGELIRFFVAESNLYFAEVRLAFRLQSKDGATLWEGVAQGDARRFGRSLKEENYDEVLSDATKEAYANLLSDQALQDAWAGKRTDPSNVVLGMSPDALLQELIGIRKDGLSTELLVAYVRQKILNAAFTPGDLSKWKQAGMPDAVIQAALERAPGAGSTRSP